MSNATAGRVCPEALSEDAALGSRGEISGAPGARVAEAHRYQGDLARVIERLAIDPEPFAQAVPARIFPRYAAGMDPPAWGLADDQDARSRVRGEDRPWPGG